MSKQEKSEIEKLNDRLYSRTNYQGHSDPRSPVRSEESPEVSSQWQTPGLDEMLKHKRQTPGPHPLLKRIFLIALVFFVISAAVAGFVFVGGVNFVSSRNVDINIVGPTIVSAGETFSLAIGISNANNADIKSVDLSIQYPEGSRDTNAPGKSLSYDKESLGVIEAGSEIVYNLEAVLLGPVGEAKDIKFSIEYQVEGSNATFYKDKVYSLIIGDIPLVLEVTAPSSVVSGESFETLVSVTLKASEILKNVVLKAEYPYGYNVTASEPSGVADDNFWLLGDLLPETKKTITITGRLTGEDKDERTLRFYVGVGDGSEPNLDVAIVSTLKTLSIERPFIGLDVLFNGEDRSLYLAPAGKVVPVSLSFNNNLPEKLLNPKLEVTLSGQALDKTSVSTGGTGFYDPSSSKVTWNLSDTSGRAELPPGSGGQVSLRFASLPKESLGDGSNDIAMKIVISGALASSPGQRNVVVTETRTVRISSQLDFEARSLYSLGPFANHGPIPPKAGKETTYTVVWSINNTQSAMADAKVTASLGDGVGWLGASSFQSENISYEPESNLITWELGVLSGVSEPLSASREVAFQVSVTPLDGQIGLAPTLVANISFSGRDTATGKFVTVEKPPLTTLLANDPVFIQGDDIVVK